MKHDEVRFFFTTSNNRWSKGKTFKSAFDELKKVNSNKCECVVYMTTDTDAYIDQISGGVCSNVKELTQFIGRFKFSQCRLSPIAEPK